MEAEQVDAEVARLKVELEHRDQLLALVHARADTLRASVERLERQLEVAAEAQRSAATERAELRRLLGNAQLQVQSLAQLPAPGDGADGAAGSGAPGWLASARRPLPRRAPRRRTRRRRRGIFDDMRAALQGLRRVV